MTPDQDLSLPGLAVPAAWSRADQAQYLGDHVDERHRGPDLMIGVDLRDVQTAARHADPRTTRRYDRARNNLDRHPSYILAAYTAAGT